MSNAAQVILAGFARGFIHRLDTAGYPVGITGALINGADAGSYELLGVKTADMAVPEPEKTDITGNNRYMGAFTWPLGASPTGTVEAAVMDQTLNAALEGTKVQTIGGSQMSVLGAKEADPKAICLILQTDAYSQTQGYVGLSKKFGLIVPKATAQALGISSINERAALMARLRLTIQMADVFPWGEALDIDDIGATEAIMIPFTSDYFVDLHAFKGDAATATVVLDRTPAGGHTSDPLRVLVYVNGTALVAGEGAGKYTVNTVTKTVTFGTAPAAGAKVAIWYEYV